jgi:hypothetical protein
MGYDSDLFDIQNRRPTGQDRIAIADSDSALVTLESLHAASTVEFYDRLLGGLE